MFSGTGVTVVPNFQFRRLKVKVTEGQKPPENDA